MPRTKTSTARQRGADVPQTSAQILDVAERLAQTRGLNGFSYADIATELGITKASLHYHYRSKADLGRALVHRYSRAFAAALDRIDQSHAPAPVRLKRYVAIYADVLARGRICLCGMLAAEYSTLPPAIQEAIRGFFELNERWLSHVLERGRSAGTLDFTGPARDAARAITSTLEGAMLLARPFGGAPRFAATAERLLREFALPPKDAPVARRPASSRQGRTHARPAR